MIYETNLRQSYNAGRETQMPDHELRMRQSTDDRFTRQVAPYGSPWAPLAPSTLARKKGNKILRQYGHLQDTIRHSVSGNELSFGTEPV